MWPAHGNGASLVRACRHSVVSALPTHQLHFPQKLKMGTPKSKIGIGKFGEIQGFCRISTETSGLGIPGTSFWGPHFADLGEMFWGNENGQSWYVGQGWALSINGGKLPRGPSIRGGTMSCKVLYKPCLLHRHKGCFWLFGCDSSVMLAVALHLKLQIIWFHKPKTKSSPWSSALTSSCIPSLRLVTTGSRSLGIFDLRSSAQGTQQENATSAKSLDPPIMVGRDLSPEEQRTMRKNQPRTASNWQCKLP